MLPETLKKSIVRANRLLHSMPGYAETYDDRHPYMVNSFAQREFWADLRRIRRHQERSRPGGDAAGCMGRALDLGAGTGNLSLKLLRLGYEVTALDLAGPMLDRLHTKAAALPRSLRRRLIVISAEAESWLATPGRPFDLIVMCSFLHHVPDYVRILELCVRRLNANGVLYFVHEPLPLRSRSLAMDALTAVDRAMFLARHGLLWEKVRARQGHDTDTADGPPAVLSGRAMNRLSRLADYHVYRRGIEPHLVRCVFEAHGLEYRLAAYSLMNTALVTRLARLLDFRDMLKGLAWKR
ncbi:MAG: hypothetical protein Kow0059_03350 [Candidatus Sumerlaeia bacterium]